MILQISLNDFKHWKIFPTIEQMKEGEENCVYPPRFQFKCKPKADNMEPLFFSFEVFKKFENKETKTKETENVGQFQFIKEVEGTYIAIM